jgi:hypothetical protein
LLNVRNGRADCITALFSARFFDEEVRDGAHAFGCAMSVVWSATAARRCSICPLTTFSKLVLVFPSDVWLTSAMPIER